MELELKDEENLLVYGVVKYLDRGMEMEKVQGLGLVVAEVVHSPSSAFLEIHKGLKSGPQLITQFLDHLVGVDCRWCGCWFGLFIQSWCC